MIAEAETTLAALALAAVGAAVVAWTGQGTRAGALAGLVVAALAILGFGAGALLPLATFVLGAGALTRIGRGRKEAAGAAEANRGRRGVRHVLAKLGLPAILALLALSTATEAPLALAYSAALAGALADTAATEVGPLVPGTVLAWRRGRFHRLTHGTPGGMSAAGLAASALGACAVAGGALLSGLLGSTPDAAVVAGAGFVATLVESIVAGTPAGPALGHFGRNAVVSLVAAGAGLAAGALGRGGP